MSQQPSRRKVLTQTEQLVLLRDLTKQTGGIHDAQVLQLRLWPFAVDPTLVKAEAHVGPEETPPVVKFVWSGSTLKIDRRYCNRVLELIRCVKFMLGRDWTVEIERDGVVIFGNGVLNVDSGIVAGTVDRRRPRKRRHGVRKRR